MLSTILWCTKIFINSRLHLNDTETKHPTLVYVSALKIHMSESAHEAIMAFPEFITECRGVTYVKVKNNVVAAFLVVMYCPYCSVLKHLSSMVIHVRHLEMHAFHWSKSRHVTYIKSQ